MRKLTYVALFLLVLGSTFAVAGVEGNLEWDDENDGGGLGAPDTAVAAATYGRLLFVGGSAAGMSVRPTFTVRAYDSQSGSLRWEDQFDGPGGTGDSVNDILASAGRVVAVGSTTLPGGGLEFRVQSYDTFGGNLQWEDAVAGPTGDQTTTFSAANAVAHDGQRIFAVGKVGTDPIGSEYMVRAYDPRNGAMLWEDRVGGGNNNDEAVAVAVSLNRVHVVGLIADPLSTGSSFVVRSYNPATGDLLWDDRIDGISRRSIAISAGEVLVPGSSADLSQNFLRSYSAFDGTLLSPGDLGAFNPTDVMVRGSRICLSGTSQGDFAVRCHSAVDGSMLWEATYGGPAGVGDVANRISIQGNRVVAVGIVDMLTDQGFYVAAFSALTGDPLWSDRHDGSSDGFDQAKDVAVFGNRVHVVGQVANTTSGNDFVVRSYAARYGFRSAREPRRDAPRPRAQARR